MTDKHLDDAIDRAVREMMSAEPASDLRQRVLDTITRPRRRAIAWSALAYGSAALAAIVLLVVSLVTRRPDVPETRVAGTTTVSPAPAPTTTPTPVDPQPAPQPSLSLPGRSPSSPGQARGTSTPPVGVPNFADRRVEAASIPGRARARIRDNVCCPARASGPARHCHDRRAADRDERDRNRANRDRTHRNRAAAATTLNCIEEKTCSEERSRRSWPWPSF